MKINIFLIAALFISLSFNSIAQSVDEGSVPETVKKALNSKFTISGTPDWTLNNDEYTAEFYIGNDKGSATYKADGGFVKSDIVVNPESVPEPVKAYVENTFRGFKINYARKYEFKDKKDNYFYVTAPKEVKGGKKYIPEFSVTNDGRLISEVIPPELEPYRSKQTATKPASTRQPEKLTAAPKTTEKQTPEPKKPAKEAKQDDNAMPPQITDHFSKNFKQISDLKWRSEEDNYIADFMAKGQLNHAFYKKDFSFDRVEIDVNPRAIPPMVNKTIVSNYPGQRVISIVNTTTAAKQKYYDIKLSKKQNKQELITQIHTNMTGQVIKEILPEAAANEEQADVLSDESVPIIVKESFEKKYLKAGEVKWEVKEENYIGNFFLKGEKNAAEYDASGNWIQTVKNVPQIKIPAPVKMYIDSKYKKEKIITSQFIEKPEDKKIVKFYYIETKAEGKKSQPAKINKIKLTPAGKLIEQSSDVEEIEEKVEPAPKPEKSYAPERTEKKPAETKKQETKQKSWQDIEREKAEQEKAAKKAEDEQKIKEEAAKKEQQRLEEKAKKDAEKKMKKKQKEDKNIEDDIEKDFKDENPNK